MIRTTLAVFMLFTPIASIAKESTDNHYKLMEAYTHIAGATLFAELNCPGMKANKTNLIILRNSAKITDAEEPMIDESLKNIAAELSKQFATSGKLSWCSDAYDSFGPQGKLIKGFLYR